MTVKSPIGWTIPGSYTNNAWFYSASYDATANRDPITASYPFLIKNDFYLKDSAIHHPTLTPVYADGNWQDAAPAEHDHPSRYLWRGTDWLHQRYPYEMGRVAIQRHGDIISASRHYTASWQTAPPPGAVNVVLWDGHAKLTGLPDLWQLHSESSTRRDYHRDC